MKKIILFIMLIPNMVFASAVYTEYEEYLRGTSEYLEESDLLKREEYQIYNTYTEQIESKYLPLESQLEDNYIIDYNDFIFENKYVLKKNEYTYNHHFKCQNNNYLVENISINGFAEWLKISEIEVITKENIDYTLKGVTYYNNFNAVQDKELYGEYIQTRPTTLIKVNFSQKVNLSDVVIKLYIKKDIEKESDLNFYLDGQQVNPNLEGKFVSSSEKDSLITINFDNEYQQFLTENNFSSDTACIAYYDSKIPLYKHTKTLILPTNNYIPFNNTDKFLFDDNKFQYNYYKREKIELVDNLYLDKNIFDINNYIISSTIPLDKLIIKNNINYDKSGTYLLEIYYNDKLITKKDIIYDKQKEESPTIAIVNDIPKEVNKTKEKIITENFEANPDEKEKGLEKSTYTTSLKSKNTTTKKQNTNLKKSITPIKNKIATSHIQKLNNKISENKSKPNFVLVAIVSILLISLVIFEYVLLYVKRKYF